ncbi:MAG: response regulator [Nitrospinae bacterium]|nr:response regulator [Nitrospinota bacterium]
MTSADAGSSGGTSEKKPLVLVVEDDEVLRLVLTTELARIGFLLAEAEHGEKALAVMAQQRPDIIVTDLMMPVLDGFGLIERVKSLPEFAGVPIIAITASNNPEMKSKALALGVAYFMMKPFASEDLTEVINRYL